VQTYTPIEVINIIAIQTEISRDALKRVDAEGLVVRDLKGSVVAHPGIEIASKSQKMVHDLMLKYRK